MTPLLGSGGCTSSVSVHSQAGELCAQGSAWPAWAQGMLSYLCSCLDSGSLLPPGGAGAAQALPLEAAAGIFAGAPVRQVEAGACLWCQWEGS